jgi:hypothetical protein
MQSRRQADLASLAIVERLIALGLVHLSVSRLADIAMTAIVEGAIERLQVDRIALVLRLDKLRPAD